MKVSVVVCTRNRSEMLVECLEALSASRDAQTEILVVDQSTDRATVQAVSRLAESDDRIRCIRSQSVGLSRARNIGVRESVGDVIAFTDDDCVPADDWVRSLVAVLEHHPAVDALYGRSLPWNPVPRGERQVALKTDGRERLYGQRCNPWTLGHGNNMAFRRRVFDTVGCFDEAMGPGGRMKNCDDADFTYRVLSAGLKAMYSPEPTVYHKQFRHGKDRWNLEKDYGIGAGALYMKHLRCGDLYVLRLLLDRWSRAGAFHVAYGALTGQKSHLLLGWYRVAYSILGMWSARKLKVDIPRRIFVEG